VNPGANDDAALAHRRERGRHQFPGWRVDDCRVERFGRGFTRASGPGGAEPEGESLRGRVAFAREGKNPTPLFSRGLHDDVGRRPKSIKTESLRVARKAKRAPADETRTEQRGKRGGGAFFAQWKSIARIGDRVGRITAIARVAREDRPVAKVFPLACTIGTDSAGRSKPRNADPLTNLTVIHVRAERIDAPDDLMPWNDRELRVWQFAINDVEIGPADAASLDPDPKLARAGNGIGQFLENQWRAYFVQDHAEHWRLSPDQTIKTKTIHTGSTEATWNVCRPSSSRTDT
jgi:hypothetical protein